MALPKIYTTDELAGFLATSPLTLIRRRREKLPPRWVKFGGAIRYTETDVLAWLQAGGDDTPPQNANSSTNTNININTSTQKRGRGRPRKPVLAA